MPLTRLQHLEQAASEVGLHIGTYSPGDGVTRYRFFVTEAGQPLNSYFGPRNGIYTALGLKEAWAFLAGYTKAK